MKILSFLLFAFTAVACAAPVTYTFNFTLAPGSFVSFGATPVAPDSGSFVYDDVTTTFSNFLVNYNNKVWDLTQSANTPTGFGNCSGLANTAANSFALLQKSLPCSPQYMWSGFTGSQGDLFTISASVIGPPAIIAFRPLLPGIPVAGPGSSNSGDFSIQAVPEPATFGFMGAGLMGCLALHTKRRRRSSSRSGLAN